MSRHAWHILTGVLLGAATVARADPLGPTRASQVVTMFLGTPGSCRFHPDDFPVGRVLPDGTTQPITIPPDQVLIVTGVETTIGCSPNSGDATMFFLIDGTQYNVVHQQSILLATGPDGFTYGQLNLTLPVGIVVGPGAKLCVQRPNNCSIRGFTAHGYFSKNQ
jgi:hypothetical protein